MATMIPAYARYQVKTMTSETHGFCGVQKNVLKRISATPYEIPSSGKRSGKGKGDEMTRQYLTRDEFLKIKGDRKPDDETHDAAGAMLYWNIDGKIYIEWQPDIGGCEWWVEPALAADKHGNIIKA